MGGGQQAAAARKKNEPRTKASGHSEKEKWAACESKRPKSREETPKEGSDNAQRYRTATICDCAAQKARTIDEKHMQHVHN